MTVFKYVLSREYTFRRIDRTFAFIDLSGFTAYADEYGDEAGMAILEGFRNSVRLVAAKKVCGSQSGLAMEQC